MADKVMVAGTVKGNTSSTSCKVTFTSNNQPFDKTLSKNTGDTHWFYMMTLDAGSYSASAVDTTNGGSDPKHDKDVTLSTPGPNEEHFDIS